MWKRFLASGGCIAAAVFLGILLALPAVKTGLVADDFFHWAVLSKRIDNSHPGSLLGMFSFADGDPARTHEYMAKGVFPWWASETVRLSFWRPLSEVTHWLDYSLWPNSIPLMHIHSMLWYGALICGLGFWLRSIDPDKSRAGLATLIYAVSGAHGTIVGWIANRNALVAAFFALMTLIAFHRARQSVGRSSATIAYMFSYIAFVLSLFGGEAAIATGSYLFAYVLLVDKRSNFVSRLSYLLPFAVIVLVWKYFYGKLGYGSHEAGIYIDPVVEPLRFMYNAAMRVPALLLAQFFGVPSILYNFVPSLPLQILYSSLAFAMTAVFVLALRSLSLQRNRMVLFYALGALLATIPVCAAGPDDRLLTFVGFGGAGLIAHFLCTVAERFKELRHGTQKMRGVGLIVLAGYLVLIHFVVAPITLTKNVNTMAQVMGPYIEYPAISFPEEKLSAKSRLMLINPPLPSAVAYVPFIRDYYGLKAVHSAFAMAPGSRAMTLEATDENTLQITVPEGFVAPMDNFFRDPRIRFSIGAKINLDGVDVAVMDVTLDGQPRTVQFHFVDALNSEDIQFFLWQKDKYREFSLPAIGKKIEIHAFDFRNPERELVSES